MLQEKKRDKKIVSTNQHFFVFHVILKCIYQYKASLGHPVLCTHLLQWILRLISRIFESLQSYIFCYCNKNRLKYQSILTQRNGKVQKFKKQSCFLRFCSLVFYKKAVLEILGKLTVKPLCWRTILVELGSSSLQLY